MNLRRFEKVRVVVTSLLVAVLVAALVTALFGFVARQGSPRFSLTSGTGFTITSVVDGVPGSYPTDTCSGTGARILPATPRCFLYTVKNPLSIPMTVNSLTVTGVSLTPATATHPHCSPGKSTFTTTLATTTFSGNLPVPAKSGGITGTASVGEPITWKTTLSTQDGCEGATFKFSLHGTASYSSVCTGGASRCLVFTKEPARTQTNHDIGSAVDSTPQGTPPVVVEVISATGTITTSFSGTVTVSLTGSPIPPATLTGTTTVTVVNGLATFSTLTITHAGSYKLVATAKPTASTPAPATSTRFNIDTRLVHCTSTPCTATGSKTGNSVAETTTNNKVCNATTGGCYLDLDFGIASTFKSSCGTAGVLKTGKYTATVDVLDSSGVSTLQHGTTWVVTYTIAKTIVKATTPGASKWQTCFASTLPFTALTTKPAPTVTLKTGGVTVPYYVGLLRDCSKSVTAPCVVSRNKTRAGQEVIVFRATGDSFVRP